MFLMSVEAFLLVHIHEMRFSCSSYGSACAAHCSTLLLHDYYSAALDGAVFLLLGWQANALCTALCEAWLLCAV